MKRKVYVETSVVSYLTAWPWRDVVTLGNQVATREWWRQAATRFELVVSPLVIEESSVGDPEAARARLATLESVGVIDAGDDAIALAGFWSRRMPFRLGPPPMLLTRPLRP